MNDLEKRNEEIKAMRTEKRWSLEKIAIFFGVSRQRVHQIVGSTGFYTHDYCKINQAVDYLDLDTSKTNEEMYEKTGKYPKWGGLRHALKDGSSVKAGFDIEDYVSETLDSLGIRNVVTNSRKYDIVLENGKTIEVKSRRKPHQQTDYYFFPLFPKISMSKPADFFILVIVKENKNDCFIIPKDAVPAHGGIGFTWPKSKQKRGNYSCWTEYHNRFDLLK